MNAIGEIVAKLIILILSLFVEQPVTELPCNTPAPVTAQGWTELFDRTSEWGGSDLMGTIEISDGTRIWLFGDTFHGPIENGKRTIWNISANSAILQHNGCTRILSDSYKDWVESPWDGEILWPKGGIVEGNLLLVFMDRIERGGEALGFTQNGTAIAVFSLTNLTNPLYVYAAPSLPSGEGIGFDMNTIDGQTCFTGHSSEGTYLVCTQKSVLNFNEWEWLGIIHPKQIRIDEDNLRAYSVDFLTMRMDEWKADSFSGPWISTDRSLDLNLFHNGIGVWSYHPDVIEGNTYVNYNSFTLQEIIDDVWLYGPTFLNTEGFY